MHLTIILAPLLSVISASLTFALSLSLVNSLPPGDLTLPQRFEAYEVNCVRIQDRIAPFLFLPTSAFTIQECPRSFTTQVKCHKTAYLQ